MQILWIVKHPVSYTHLFQKVEPNKECFEALQMIVSEKWDGSLGATYFESESSSTWHRDNLNYLYSHGGHDFYIDREE